MGFKPMISSCNTSALPTYLSSELKAGHMNLPMSTQHEKLPNGLIAYLVEHCIHIAVVMSSKPVLNVFFWGGGGGGGGGG